MKDLTFTAERFPTLAIIYGSAANHHELKHSFCEVWCRHEAANVGRRDLTDTGWIKCPVQRLVCIQVPAMLDTAVLVGKTLCITSWMQCEGHRFLFQLYIRQRGGSYVPARQSLIACTFHMNAFRCGPPQGLWSYCQGINCICVCVFECHSVED